MMQYVQAKLNPGLPWQNQHSVGRKEVSFHQQTVLQFEFEEETSEVLHLEHSFVCAETWDTS